MSYEFLGIIYTVNTGSNTAYVSGYNTGEILPNSAILSSFTIDGTVIRNITTNSFIIGKHFILGYNGFANLIFPTLSEDTVLNWIVPMEFHSPCVENSGWFSSKMISNTLPVTYVGEVFPLFNGGGEERFLVNPASPTLLIILFRSKIFNLS